MPPDVMWAMCEIFLTGQRADLALITALAFYGFLRTTEALCLRKGQLHFANTLERVVMHLWDTKTSARKGHLETVTVEEPLIVKRLAQYIRKLEPGDTVLSCPPRQYYYFFKCALARLKLEPDYKPYSLRRGGASSHFRTYGNLNRTQSIGR